MEVSINGDTPAGWFIMEFMIWGYPYFRKPSNIDTISYNHGQS